MMKNTNVDVALKNIPVEFVRTGCDWFGWGGELMTPSAYDLLTKPKTICGVFFVEDISEIQLSRCPICGKWFIRGENYDWDASICSLCAEEMLGDSHDWSEAQYSLWNGDHAQLLDEDISAKDVCEKVNKDCEAFKEEDGPVTEDFVNALRKFEKLAKVELPMYNFREVIDMEIKAHTK